MNERQSGATTPDDFQEKLIEYIKQTAVKHAISPNKHGMKRKISTQTGGKFENISLMGGIQLPCNLHSKICLVFDDWLK